MIFYDCVSNEFFELVDDASSDYMYKFISLGGDGGRSIGCRALHDYISNGFFVFIGVL